MSSPPSTPPPPEDPAAGDTVRDRRIRRLRRGAGPTGPGPGADALTADSLTSTEQVFLAELDWWTVQHGHAQVPQSATSRSIAGRPYQLGHRVARARLQHQRGELPKVMADELERRPGWSWSVLAPRLEHDWHQQADLLRRHVHQHESLEDLPLPLQRWLRNQRRQHAAGQLPAERVAVLEQIPGVLIRGDTAVPAFVAAATAWLAADPDRSMRDLRVDDVIELDGRVAPIGRQATYYRRRYHGLEGSHPLPSDEIEAIAGLRGWSWELRRRGRPPGARNRPRTSSPSAAASEQPGELTSSPPEGR